MFLRGYQRFGKHRVSADDANAYVAEMAKLAHDLGAEDPPTDRPSWMPRCCGSVPSCD